MTKLRVAIVGCGPSGVVATKALLAESNFYSVRVFERRSKEQAGIGAWNFSPAKESARRKPSTVPSLNPDCVDQPDVVPTSAEAYSRRHVWSSPMYRDLCTNIPARLMEFNTASFRQDTELFPKREVVADYLSAYASSILQHVNFDTEVVSITKTDSAEWQVQSRGVHEGEDAISTEIFDRVVIATGHYETPRIPHYPGLREFNQKYPSVVRHSKYYRTPDEYRGKTVLTVGSGPSGIDIAHQISTVSNHPLYQSTRSPITVAPYSEGIQNVSQIRKFNQDGSIELVDGSVLKVDHVLFCTGYLYSFPFLHLGSAEDGTLLVTDGERLHHLYEQILYMHDPTIAFLAQGMNIVPFPMAEAQSCFLARVWRGRITLPPLEDMLARERELVCSKGDGRAVMAMPHPEDGAYIDRLRRACLAADSDASSTTTTEHAGMLPVDWMGSDRITLRAKGKQLRMDWLAQKQQVR